MFDEYAYVLAVKGNNAMVIGCKYLTPLEVILRKGTDATTVGEKLYIGKEKREKVYSIRKKLSSEEMAKIEPEEFIPILETIVKENSEFYLNFINNSKPISIKRHQLQVLPNVGDKSFQKIISERDKEPFKSLEDVEERADFNAVKSIAQRVYNELTEPDKYFFFVKKPKLTKGDQDIPPYNRE